MTAPQRTEKWQFRVTEQSDTLVREAATLSGMSMTSFVEESAVERAQTVIAEHQRISLSPEEFSLFSKALDEAPVAIPELVDLFSRQSQIPQS